MPSPCVALALSVGQSFCAGADLPIGVQWNCWLWSDGTRSQAVIPSTASRYSPLTPCRAQELGGSAGQGVCGGLDDVCLSLTLKASHHCVCADSQGVLTWCCKMCFGESMPGMSINSRYLSKATSLHPKIPRWKTTSESEAIWVEVAFGADKIAFYLCLKTLMHRITPNHKHLRFCCVIKWTFSMARLREVLRNAQHQRPVFHFHQQTCLSSRTTVFCGTSQMLRVAWA